MNFFKNITVNLKAKGPAAVLIVWMICLTMIALFGESRTADSVVGFLGGIGVMIIFSLGRNSEGE